MNCASHRARVEMFNHGTPLSFCEIRMLLLAVLGQRHEGGLFCSCAIPTSPMVPS